MRAPFRGAFFVFAPPAPTPELFGKPPRHTGFHRPVPGLDPDPDRSRSHPMQDTALPFDTANLDKLADTIVRVGLAVQRHGGGL